MVFQKMALGKIIQNGDQKFPPQKWSFKSDRKKSQVQTFTTPQNGCPIVLIFRKKIPFHAPKIIEQNCVREK